MHHVLKIDASPSQLSKLRNGHAVRIKKGKGFNLIVHPETYHIASRAFAKNKGVEIALSPQEIEANKNPDIYVPAVEAHDEDTLEGQMAKHSQMIKEGNARSDFAELPFHGGSIFGKKFDRMLKRNIGAKNVKILHDVGNIAKPFVKKAMREGLKAGGEALGSYAPELAPLIPVATEGLAKAGDSFLEGPNKGKGLRHIHSGLIASVPDAMRSKLSRAGMDKALANASSAHMLSDAIKSRYHASRPASLNAGGPLNEGMGFHHKRHEHGSIGRGGGMLQSRPYMPPALESQPLGANFQMRFFLPPQYQIHGNGLFAGGSGSGLFAGGRSGQGLYA